MVLWFSESQSTEGKGNWSQVLRDALGGQDSPAVGTGHYQEPLFPFHQPFFPAKSPIWRRSMCIHYNTKYICVTLS